MGEGNRPMGNKVGNNAR